MTTAKPDDAFRAASSYEDYMGRWSRQLAPRFLDWLGAPAGADWLEVGCGTGALSAAILEKAAPRSLLAIDPSAAFVAHAGGTLGSAKARFEVGDGQAPPAADASLDVVASALVLNFIPDPAAALRAWRRVLRPGGLIGFYVWDYPGGGMGFIAAFWEAAAALDPAAAAIEQGTRFAFCAPEGLKALCATAGLPEPRVEALEITTRFPDFDAFWQPFTLGAGPAGGYLAQQTPGRQAAIRDHLAKRLGDGPVALPARAWAARLPLP